jgi:hypothetical protein
MERPDAFKARRNEVALDSAEAIRDLLAHAGAHDLGSSPVLTKARAEEMVDDLRVSRAHR